MKSSERLLVIAVVAAVFMLIAFLGFRYYSSAVESRLTLLSKKESDTQTEELKVKAALAARKKMNDYEARSLPPQPALSRSLYQHWLFTKAQDAGFHDQVVTPTGGLRAVQNIYTVMSFTVTGRARYEQVVKFLDDIYRVDLLHRVSRLSLKPAKDSKEFDVSLTLDAVSVHTAPESQTIHNRPSKRLKLDSAEKYQLAIVGRNIFAPANRAPKISGLGRQSGTTNRAVDIAAKASDPDPFDFVKLELTKSPSRDARLDSSGKLSWTPKKAGEYEFEITARDDNFPPHVSTEKLIVKVTDPPPERKPDPPQPTEEKLAFDQAKHTIFTAIIGVGEESEVWLYIRPTATILKLHEGEKFEVGSIKGTVREIGSDEFVFESSAKATKGQQLLVSRGELLEQAAPLGAPPPAVPPEVDNPKVPANEKPVAVKPVDVKPTEVPVEEKPTEEKPVPEKPVATKPELQNLEDVILAEKIPPGFTAVKRDMEVMGEVHGVILTVMREGIPGGVVISRENRPIEINAARRAATKGYINGAVKGMVGQGWKLKTDPKSIPSVDDFDFAKLFKTQFEFEDADGNPQWVDITTMFSPTKGHSIMVVANNAEDLKLLRAWAATVKPIDGMPAPAENTPGTPGNGNDPASEEGSPKAE